MRTGSAAHLVDTNVLVYAYDNADAAKQQRAIEVLSRLVTRRNGAISAQIMGEFFIASTRRIAVPLSQAEAERSLVNYARSWLICDLTAATVLEAVAIAQRRSISYWDALIWATAKLNGVANILSEDFSDGLLLEGVRILNPFHAAFDPAAL
jgi:predicted nucleic acid-binding protein